MPKVYVAGPMSGLPDHNFPAFFSAEDALSRIGYEVVNPARIDTEQGWDPAWPAERYMRRDLPALLQCDAIALLLGWETSRGALYEALVASITGQRFLIETSVGNWRDDDIPPVYIVGRLIEVLHRQPEKDRYPEKTVAFANSVADTIPPDWRGFPTTGDPKTWEQALDRVLAEMRGIMVERQNKYGPDNIRRQGIMGVLTRAMDDKIERIRGALNGRVERGRIVLDPIDEGSAEDTFTDGAIDAANYIGPILLMLHRGWWDLPREGQQ